jgi:hypothetical protein
MAAKICDTEPCERMRGALTHFIYREMSPPNPDLGFVAVLITRRSSVGRSEKLEKMNMKYCPFCGTRIAAGLVDWLEDVRVPPAPQLPGRFAVNGGVR